MGYKLNGSPLPIDVAFTDSDGASYPASWLRGSTAEQRAAVPTGGITWENDPAVYDQEFYWGSGKPKNIADTPTYDSYDSDGKGVGDPTGSTPGLKTNWIQKQKNIANGLLSDTDWLIVRKAEAGTAVPSDTTTYRAAVRTKCKEREDQITACSDTDALALLVGSSETQSERGTADNGAEEEKQADGSSYDPKRYEDIQVANPAALKQWPTES